MTFFKSKRTIFLLYFLSGLLISKPIFANNFYQEQLILKAKELKLSQDSKWLNMLYYEKNKLSKGYESIFDSENFFLSKDGRKNPGLELEATIRSFFDENHLSFNNIYKNKQYAQCAFQGRYQWLKKRLNFDLRKLKQRKCNDFNKWHKSLNPQSATLVFASAYLNNPASMFGHTFLLINGDNKKETRNILSYAINYAASTNETNGITFAYKGLFGLYKGQFSTAKYHQMLKKYTNLENRDIWEYDLNLNKEELKEIILNLWEINNNHANYYFFTENCSYILLRLLKIIRDEIPLRSKIINFVIPSDTVIDVNKAHGLIRNSRYRESRASNIKNLMNNSDKKMIGLSKKLVKIGTLNNEDQKLFDSLDKNKQKIIYDLSYEYLQYLYQKDKEYKRSEMAKSSFKILKKRSNISGKTQISQIKEPRTDPLLAHNPSRFGVKYGYNNIRKDLVKFSIRPAYHDLMDPSDGFLNGAAINMLDFDFNYYEKDDNFRLDQFNLVDIKSYSPRNQFFKPLSWQLRVGAKNLFISDQDLKLAAFAKFSSGMNFELESINSNITFLIGGLNYHGKNIQSNNLTAFVPEINFMSKITNNLKLNFNVSHNFFKQETKFNSSNYRVEQNYRIKKDLSFDGYFEKKHYQHFRDDNEFGIGLKYYY